MDLHHAGQGPFEMHAIPRRSLPSSSNPNGCGRYRDERVDDLFRFLLIEVGRCLVFYRSTSFPEKHVLEAIETCYDIADSWLYTGTIALRDPLLPSTRARPHLFSLPLVGIGHHLLLWPSLGSLFRGNAVISIVSKAVATSIIKSSRPALLDTRVVLLDAVVRCVRFPRRACRVE